MVFYLILSLELYNQLDHVLSTISYNVPLESKESVLKSRKDLEQEEPVKQDVRDLALQTESEPYVLAWSAMKSLSRQIYQELIQRFGSPSVVKVGSEFIMFGTKSSKILLFDLKQKLIGILDPPLRKIIKVFIFLEFAVTALGISYSQKLIVSGHESGHIFVWDRFKKTVIKAILPIPSNGFNESLDGHLASSAIIHLTFVGQKDRFISADDTVF
jgi:WD40 repeat protein